MGDSRMKTIAIISLILLGCTKDPISTEITQNINFTVDFLFEKDGCKIYRFYDNGRSHYYTNCTETISVQYCGKACEYNENITNKEGKIK